MRTFLLLLLGMGLLPALPRGEALVVDWKVEWVARDPAGSRREIHRRERVTILPDRMRIDDATFGMTWIVRGDRELVWVVDRLQGRYSELSFEAIRARQEEIADEISAAMARVPGTRDEKELRRILEGMGRFGKNPTVELRDTGGKENVLGRECVGRAAVLEGDRYVAEVYVDPSHSEGAAYFDLLSKMGAFHPAVAAKLSGAGGLPVRGTVRFLFFADRVTQEIEAQSVRREEVSGATFELPEGLKRVRLEGFEAPVERRVEKPKFAGEK